MGFEIDFDFVTGFKFGHVMWALHAEFINHDDEIRLGRAQISLH